MALRRECLQARRSLGTGEKAAKTPKFEGSTERFGWARERKARRTAVNEGKKTATGGEKTENERK